MPSSRSWTSWTEAFLYSEAIDVRNRRQRGKLREELTLAKIDRHADVVDDST